MCVVVDTNCIPNVFSTSSQKHKDFAPLYRWIVSGTGSLVYGGKKYKNELKQMTKYLFVFSELRKSGRVLEIDDSVVDRLAADLKRRVRDSEFNDEHLVAIVAASGCCVVCTDDKPAARFLKLKELYPAGINPPKIYNRLSHRKFCNSRHVADACRERAVVGPCKLTEDES